MVGTLLFLAAFVYEPNFPTPDKLIVLLTFIFLIFGQAQAMLKRLLPFVLLLLTYESFRSLVPQLNSRVEYIWMINADKFLFGGSLPTVTLQGWLWHGAVSWYDFVFYLAYMLHFVLPLGLALLVWKYREAMYWRLVSTYLLVSYMGFATFLLFPAAPPWLAAQNGLIQPIARVSSSVWWALGIKDFPSFYNKLSPNPVAAVPSLHAAYATLFALFVCKLFGKRWGLLAAVFPLLIYVGTVYTGEHYAVDEVIGIGYALVGYLATWWLFERYRVIAKLKLYWQKQSPLWQAGPS